MSYRENNIIQINERDLINLIESNAHDLHKSLDPLMDRIGKAPIVMLGEASHGTHEYYMWRARISRRLIEEKDFKIIGVEGDWPDCYRINRYIRNYDDTENTAFEVLKEFNRWPTWMWSNWEIQALMEWLKKHNQNKTHDRQTGFYGLDVYSLWESLEAITDYLRTNDPDALKAAEHAMQCFEPNGEKGAEYGSASRFVPESCQEEVLDLLKTIRARVPLYDSDPEAPFNAEQNAMTAVNAEKYYRAMMEGGPESWNIRDVHMTETLERLLDFHGEGAKAIVWEHNTHIGDARATDMSRGGMVNVGQLAREKWGRSDTVLVGFGSHRGTVIAARAWDDKMKEMVVPPARENSWEDLLNRSEPTDKIVINQDIKDSPLLNNPVNHRAIGVVYDPDREYYGNYVPSIIPDRYDAFVFIDDSQALHPIKTATKSNMTPETYPWGI
ncbi:MAG: erythromycin esterase family protein [Bacteroidales bacterium]|nr:erythromycin esterase family protein [Bacteroidales bacterium]